MYWVPNLNSIQAQKTAWVNTLWDFQQQMQDMQAQILNTLMNR
jgi:hypothetical protein